MLARFPAVPVRSRPRRSATAGVALALAAALGISLTLATGSPAQAAPAPLGWGTSVSSPPGQKAQAVAALEATVGRKFSLVRDFPVWDTKWTVLQPQYVSLQGSGHTLVVSVKSIRSNGTAVPWSSVAGAQPGSALYGEIEAWAKNFDSLPAPVFFTFNHEPEAKASDSFGTAADYIAAWRHVIDIFRAQPANKVSFMWITAAAAFRRPLSDPRYAGNYYPGDAWVDAIGSDAYNWYTCRTGVNTPWRSLAYLIDGQRKFGAQHPGTPLYLTEWASTEDPAVPGHKAAWIRDAQALFKMPAYAQFQAVSYFNVQGQGACTWYVGSSSAALAAFHDMGQDPFYGG